MIVIERLIAASALFVAAHFAMGFLNPSAGGSGGALIFPFASNAGSRWAFGALEGGPFVTSPSTATAKDREPRARRPELSP